MKRNMPCHISRRLAAFMGFAPLRLAGGRYVRVAGVLSSNNRARNSETATLKEKTHGLRWGGADAIGYATAECSSSALADCVLVVIAVVVSEASSEATGTRRVNRVSRRVAVEAWSWRASVVDTGRAMDWAAKKWSE